MSFAYHPLTTDCWGAPLVSPLLTSFLTLAAARSDFQPEGLPASTTAGPVASQVNMNSNPRIAPSTTRASWTGPTFAANALNGPCFLPVLARGADSGTGGTAGLYPVDVSYDDIFSPLSCVVTTAWWQKILCLEACLNKPGRHGLHLLHDQLDGLWLLVRWVTESDQKPFDR